MIPLKSEGEFRLMREGGKILARIMRRLAERVKPGVATKELDELAGDLIKAEHAVAAFKGYRGYPANICVSINEEIVHGLPGERIIQPGDIVSLDLGISYQGYFTDLAVTLGLGSLSPRLQQLVEVTRQALNEGIAKARPQNRLSDISYAIQSYVEERGFSVVREFIGHGIGRELHEEPELPNFGSPGQGALLREGMVLAIEPMVNMGSWPSRILANGWTAVAKDGLPSAHFEHTVAITESGPEVLTQ